MKRFNGILVTLVALAAGVTAEATPLGLRTAVWGIASAQRHAEQEPGTDAAVTNTVVFDANGGRGGTTRSVASGAAVGDLPMPVRTGYAFAGWFTAADGGCVVTAETPITADVTLYAHWQCVFTFGEGGVWSQQPDGSWKSGETADGAINSLSMTVNGAGTVSFRWKVSCEGYFNFKGTLLRQDGLAFFIDETETNFVNGVMSEWAECSFEIAEPGAHTLAWSYVKDSSGYEGEDCAWVDSVTWTPAGVTVDMGGGKSVTVPKTWLDSHAEALAVYGGDRNAYANSTAANGRMSVAECYVVGLDPEDATNEFKITSFPLLPSGMLDLETFRSCIDPPQAKWNVSGARPVIKGAASLDAANWPEVTEQNKASFRFFKVEVELP